MHKSQKNRLIYSILLIICIVVFWLFENFYTPGNYSSTADDSNRTEIPEEVLPSSNGSAVVHHDHYSLSYREEYEQAEWVFYSLKPKHLANIRRERPDFIEDPYVPSKSADWRNYKRSGYDRGHLCPAGDRRFSELAYQETFYTSNIVPQQRDFNAGVWNDLEKQIRIWCRRYGDLYVITGGILKPGLQSIGDEDVAVPEHFYKIVARGEADQMKVIAFLIPHQSYITSFSDYVTTVDQVEEAAGLDFFEGLPDTQTSLLESGMSLSDWPFTTIH